MFAFFLSENYESDCFFPLHIFLVIPSPFLYAVPFPGPLPFSTLLLEAESLPSSAGLFAITPPSLFLNSMRENAVLFSFLA